MQESDDDEEERWVVARGKETELGFRKGDLGRRRRCWSAAAASGAGECLIEWIIVARILAMERSYDVGGVI